jgi:hypothetical protein
VTESGGLLDRDEMAETIEYVNENMLYLTGKTHHFAIKVEGDMYAQLGQHNQFKEVWKRVKQSRPRPPGLAS